MKKEKKIYIKNTEKLTAAIKEVEGKATARTVTAEEIQKILADIDHRAYCRGVYKYQLHGTTVYYDGAQKFPRAYKHTPYSTHWKAENVHGKWYVTDIRRDPCPKENYNPYNTHIMFCDEAKQIILESMGRCNY